MLAFETSSPRLSVALGTAEGKILEARSKSPLRHSENLVPLIDHLLRKARLSLGKIDAFAIDRGPGSFTGLRIGFSLLKGFLAVRKRPCYGALSLDMIAAKIDLPESSRLGVLVDARREKIYTRFYKRQKGEWVAERKLELLSISELREKVKTRGVLPGQRQDTCRVSLTGDALVRYQEPCREFFGREVSLLEKIVYPSARTLVRWFQAGDPRLTRLATPRDFLPLYLRPSEAEEKRKTEILP